MSRAAGTILASITAFTAGVITGLLLTPRSGKENRAWISHHTGGAKHWVEVRGQQFMDESEKRISRISENLKDVLPDLYEATEVITFHDEQED